jgi:hypothetical protein
MADLDPRRYVLKAPSGDGLRGIPTPISIVTADGSDLLGQLGGAGASVLPAAQGLRFALDNNLNTGFGWHGDSTGDSTGADPADIRTPTRLAELIGEAYPNYHVLSRHWNTVTETFDQPVVLQAAPAGQAFTRFNGRSARFVPSLFITGNMDLRAKVDIPNTATGADQTLAAQVSRDGTPWGTAFVFRWQLMASGKVRLAISYDGGSWDTFESSIVMPSAFAGWMRVTLQITPSGTDGNITCRFWTSTDGGTWTEFGAMGSYGGPRSPLFASTNSDFEIGGYAWQPASDPLHGKVYEVEIRDGIDGPLLAPALPHLWERFADPTTTYGGAPTLYLVNASAGGTDLAYQRNAARLKKMTPNYGQVVTYFNDSHNEAGSSGAITWLPPYKAWVEAVQARLPLTAAIAVGQNPHTPAWANESSYGISHVFRISELATYSGRQGWGFLDLFSAFLNDPAGINALVGGDGLHPTQAGYALAGDVAFAQLGIR